jgi:hypothetical protein
MLADRAAECATLDRLLSGALAGQSAVLVLRGEPGIGKTALLDYAARQAQSYRIIRISGVESETELPFAGLHLLCSPLLDGLERLPPPQRDALRTAVGLSADPQPDRFFVGLATLNLLSAAAEARPLLDRRQLHALRPICDQLPGGPTHRGEAPPKVGDGFFGHIDPEGTDPDIHSGL